MSEEVFENLSIPKKELSGLPVGRYRVYKDASNYVNVAADTAMQALEACGFKDVYKVERDRLDAHNLLNIEEWKNLQSAPKAATPAATEEVAQLPSTGTGAE